LYVHPPGHHATNPRVDKTPCQGSQRRVETVAEIRLQKVNPHSARSLRLNVDREQGPFTQEVEGALRITPSCTLPASRSHSNDRNQYDTSLLPDIPNTAQEPPSL